MSEVPPDIAATYTVMAKILDPKWRPVSPSVESNHGGSSIVDSKNCWYFNDGNAASVEGLRAPSVDLSMDGFYNFRSESLESLSERLKGAGAPRCKDVAKMKEPLHAGAGTPTGELDDCKAGDLSLEDDGEIVEPAGPDCDADVSPGGWADISFILEDETVDKDEPNPDWVIVYEDEEDEDFVIYEDISPVSSDNGWPDETVTEISFDSDGSEISAEAVSAEEENHESSSTPEQHSRDTTPDPEDRWDAALLNIIRRRNAVYDMIDRWDAQLYLDYEPTLARAIVKFTAREYVRYNIEGAIASEYFERNPPAENRVWTFEGKMPNIEILQEMPGVADLMEPRGFLRWEADEFERGILRLPVEVYIGDGLSLRLCGAVEGMMFSTDGRFGLRGRFEVTMAE